MTKYSEMVIDPKMIKYSLEKALFLAKSGRPGPCWLDIPLNVQGAMIETDDLISYTPSIEEMPPVLKESDIDLLIEKLRNAHCPIIYAGNGIRLSGAHKQFIELIDKLGIPVVTPWNSHDIIWDEHPLYCGRRV